MNPLHKLLLFVVLLTGLTSLAQAKLVIIDAGHGGQDVGGRFGKVYEKHLALDTAMRLEYYLKKQGYQTLMIRTNDTFVTLSQRSAIANRYRGAIFISIHYNSTWKSSVEGLETFYHSSSGKALASACHQQIRGKIGSADRGVKYARYYVLRHCNHPAILVEGGFLSHTGEREKVKKGSYRDAIARGIVDGVVNFDRSGQW